MLRAPIIVFLCLFLTSTIPALQTFRSTPEFVQLGRYLFYSRLLSADGTTSCSDCHAPALGFSGKDPIAIGVAGFKAGRRAPTLLGLADAHAFAWDGRYTALMKQVAVPLESPEMRISWDEAMRLLRSDPTVTALVAKAQIKTLDRESSIAALAAYASSLKSGPAKFDRFYRENPLAFTDEEQWGYRLFIKKAGCASCHLINGSFPIFTDGNFHSVGIGAPKHENAGRFSVTGRAKDRNAFKTPTLRDVALRSFLMHDGSMTSLDQVVQYYNRGGAPNDPSQDPRIKPLFLSEAEVAAIIAFLKTLTTDEQVRSHW